MCQNWMDLISTQLTYRSTADLNSLSIHLIIPRIYLHAMDARKISNCSPGSRCTSRTAHASPRCATKSKIELAHVLHNFSIPSLAMESEDLTPDTSWPGYVKCPGCQKHFHLYLHLCASHRDRRMQLSPKVSSN